MSNNPEKVNYVMFNILWNKKLDEIKRNTICGDYLNGGLKIIDTFNFQKALKLNWIQKLVYQTEAL